MNTATASTDTSFLPICTGFNPLIFPPSTAHISVFTFSDFSFAFIKKPKTKTNLRNICLEVSCLSGEFPKWTQEIRILFPPLPSPSSKALNKCCFFGSSFAEVSSQTVPLLLGVKWGEAEDIHTHKHTHNPSASVGTRNPPAVTDAPQFPRVTSSCYTLGWAIIHRIYLFHA